MSLRAIRCDGVIVEPPAGFLGGTVTDSVSNTPVAAAFVSPDTIFGSTDVLTDTLGSYVMLAGNPGINRTAYCWKEGYLIQSKRYAVASNETTLVDFQLVPE
jgi:hypothetical protein